MVEKLSNHPESGHLITSETAKNWTEKSPKSRLKQINAKLDSAKSKEAKDLKDLISKREYKDFQKKIGIKTYYDLDGKLGPRTFEFFNNYLKKFEKDNTTVHETKDELDDLKNRVHDTERQQLSESAKIHKNAREYLSKHETLSAPEYNVIFSGKENLAQGQVGNCYMVSGLIELANTQYFDTLMRTSISRVRFKDDDSTGYNIRIPLGEPNGRDILIKDFELNSAKINGNIGYKLLEIAYVKNKRPNNAEGNRYSPVTEWEYMAITSGSVEQALGTFLGRNNIGFSNFGTFPIWKTGRTLAEASQTQRTEMTNYLKNFNGKIGNKFTCLATAPSAQGDTESFNVNGNTFWKNHAYALDSVEKDSNGNISFINVKNPWNNRYKAGGADTKLTLNEFFNTFSYMGAGKIKTDTFLDDKGVSYA